MTGVVGGSSVAFRLGGFCFCGFCVFGGAISSGLVALRAINPEEVASRLDSLWLVFRGIHSSESIYLSWP